MARASMGAPTIAVCSGALAGGARTLFTNTVLHSRHPVVYIHDIAASIGVHEAVTFVGQQPELVEACDDKHATNSVLGDHGLPVPRSTLITPSDCDGGQATVSNRHTRTVLPRWRRAYMRLTHAWVNCRATR